MDKSKELNESSSGVLSGFAVIGGFQDLSSNDRSVRVLRNDVAGVTIFANSGKGNEREIWRNRGKYVVAYESEAGPELQTEQIILETDDPTALWRLWELINTHVERIQNAITLDVQAQAVGQTPAISSQVAYDTLDIESFAGFDDEERKAHITDTLELLSNTSAEDAYVGFVNAVFSKIDDWLMARRYCTVGLHHHDRVTSPKA